MDMNNTSKFSVSKHPEFIWRTSVNVGIKKLLSNPVHVDVPSHKKSKPLIIIQNGNEVSGRLMQYLKDKNIGTFENDRIILVYDECINHLDHMIPKGAQRACLIEIKNALKSLNVTCGLIEHAFHR